ncbi:helix-turn-helix domain-containing protein, partial [Streptomyces sp. NPDC057699]|uniref:helix-turn-helix domain-containing protein n=1 Tax=Streptomyces sp. NPDC057699 TaxID=3346220 RepID=UPI0036A0243D
MLDAAQELFYGRGVQAVGMDAVRSASGVSLKRLYQLFPSKDALVLEFLRQRDVRWRGGGGGEVGGGEGRRRGEKKGAGRWEQG